MWSLAASEGQFWELKSDNDTKYLNLKLKDKEFNIFIDISYLIFFNIDSEISGNNSWN